jgi:flagellar hook-length control protein FliK
VLHFRSDSVAASNVAAGPAAAPAGPARGGAKGFDRLLDMLSEQPSHVAADGEHDAAEPTSIKHDAAKPTSLKHEGAQATAVNDKTDRAATADDETDETLPLSDADRATRVAEAQQTIGGEADQDARDRSAAIAALLPFLTAQAQNPVLRRVPIAAANDRAGESGTPPSASAPDLTRVMAVARLVAQRAADANAKTSANAAAAATDVAAFDNASDATNTGAEFTTLTAAASAAIAAEAARELALEPDRHPAPKNGTPIDVPRDFHRIPFGTTDRQETQTRQAQADAARTNNSRTTTDVTPSGARPASGPSPSIVPVQIAPPGAVGAAMAVMQSADRLASATLESGATSVVSQLVEAIRIQATRGGGDAQITLEPKYLGAVTLSIRVDRDVVTASAVVESPMVREWMRSNEGLLRQGLAEHGLRLDRLHVAEPPAETPGREKETDGHAPARDQRHQKPRQRHEPESAPAFELNVQ